MTPKRAVLALIVGTVVEIMTYYLLVWVITESVGFHILDENSVHTLTKILLTMPGAFTAGFLGSSRPSGGAIYGIVVVMMGVALPFVVLGSFFLDLLGFPRTITVFVIVFGSGFLVVVGLFGGGVGGALEAMTRAQRTTQREEETLN